jgi:ABC-type transport system involved in Fe-S cluster assembly fused permease/ATPase subunit
METEKRRTKLALSSKLLILSFILLLVDFVLYKLFGEPYKGGYSFGRSLFTAISILTLVSFLAFWIALIAERISSKKKNKKNENSA